MPLRLVFMGTPDFAVPTLVELAGAGHAIEAVYTRAPKPKGRGMDLQDTPVAREAKRLGIPVLTPLTLRTPEAQAEFSAHDADAAVVVAYGLLLPKSVLDAVPLGCFNLHASLLPRWRGAAPIHRALMAGDAVTGVMAMKMEEGLDTGPVGGVERIAIGPDVTTGELDNKLSRIGADLMLRTIGALERGALKLTSQPSDGVTYASKIDKNESRIDWSKSWNEVHNHSRGLSPFPGAWFELQGEGGPVRVKVLRTTKGEGKGPPGTLLDDKLTVACGEGAIRILELQRAGKQPMKADEFLRGSPLRAGISLS